MQFSGLSWKLLLGNALLLTTTGAAAFWLTLSVVAPHAPRDLRAAGCIAAAVAAIVAVSTLAVGYGLTRIWRAPLRRIVRTVRKLSEGDLSARVEIPPSDELGLLARALNDMRGRLVAHSETIDRQRRTLESLLTQLQEGVAVVGSDGRIVLINPAAIRLLSLAENGAVREDAFVGQALERCIPQHDLQQLIRRSQPGAADECRLQVDSAGRKLHLLARASNIALPSERGPRGESAEGRLLVVTDITELARAVQMKTDFVANASHELRTPLSTIRAAIEALLPMDFAAEPEAAGRFIRAIDRHSERLVAMVSDLLDLSRVESSPATFETRTIDWANFVADLHDRFDERLAGKSLRWTAPTTDDAGRPLEVTCNEYLLRLVLDNLVDNAIKFTPSGGAVAVALQCEATTARVEVTDTGCGILPEDQERVFERFYQVERARSGPERGTGLGLSIVRHAVAALRGSVTLTSELGRGSRFSVLIPQ